MKLIEFDTRGILCGREGQMATSESGTVGFLQQIARQNHVLHPRKLKVGALICVASMAPLNARMKLTGFDRRRVLYGRQAQMVSSKSGVVAFLQQIERENPVISTNQLKFGPLICAAALNARCSTEQMQVITGEGPIITHLPASGEEKSLELDEGGSGFPPDDSDSGGGGGDGGGNWLGGFFLFWRWLLALFFEDKDERFSASRNMSILTKYFHKILHLVNISPASLELFFAILLANILVFSIGTLFVFYISFLDWWDAICSVLLFVLVWGMLFVVHILRRYNRITGLTGIGASDDLLNWRYRAVDSSSELMSHTNGNDDPFAENPECCICLAEYEDDEEIQTLPCSHVFHLECVDRWLRIKSFCPLCKQNVQR